MTPKEYFPKLFEADNKRFEYGDICGVAMLVFWEEVELKKWPNLAHFLICQYELNLLSQVVHAHFILDYNLWSEVTAKFANCGCGSGHGGVSHPLSILKVAEKEINDFQRRQLRSANDLHAKTKSSCTVTKFDIPIELIYEYDKFFLNYSKDIIANNSFVTLTLDGLIKAIKKDPDCNSNYVKNYFALKLGRQKRSLLK